MMSRNVMLSAFTFIMSAKGEIYGSNNSRCIGCNVGNKKIDWEQSMVDGIMFIQWMRLLKAKMSVFYSGII